MYDTMDAVTRRWRASWVITLLLLAVHREPAIGPPLPGSLGQVPQRLVLQPDEGYNPLWLVSYMLDRTSGERVAASEQPVNWIVPGQPSVAEEVEALIPVYFGFDPQTAHRVLVCESHLGVGLNDFNVWQINRPTWEDFFIDTQGWTWQDITGNLDINFQAALIIWKRGGWFQWHC